MPDTPTDPPASGDQSGTDNLSDELRRLGKAWPSLPANIRHLILALLPENEN